MKLHIQSDVLQKKLPFINRAISSRSQLPILLNLLLEAKNNVLKISATDLEVGIQIEIPVTVEEEGGITVPAKILSELITSLPAEKITLETKDLLLQVVSKHTKSVFQSIAKDEFPKLYEEKGQEITVIKKQIIEKEFSKIAFAASIDTSRPALSAVLMKKNPDKNGLELIATDGYRLSFLLFAADQTTVSKTERGTSILIPARVVREVIAMKQDGDIALFIAKQQNQIIFSQNSTIVVGRLIEAEYPNYEKIIPTESATQVTFDKEELQKAVKICSIFARETANIVKLSFKKTGITVSSQTPSVGENSVDVEAKVVGEENEIAFNARYLLDLFSHVDDEEMVFEMTGPLNPGVFRIKDSPSFFHLIMPIRVQG